MLAEVAFQDVDNKLKKKKKKREKRKKKKQLKLTWFCLISPWILLNPRQFTTFTVNKQ